MQTTIQLQLEPKDHLAFQLYLSSQSKSVTKKRKRTKMILPLIYAVFAILFISRQNFYLGLAFIMLGISWYYLYPLYESKRYVKKYVAIINKSFGEIFVKNVKLELTEKSLTSFDLNGESKTNLKHISEIDETSSHYFILLKSGISFILPKNKIEKIGEFHSWLDMVLKKYPINWYCDLNWEWK